MKQTSYLRLSNQAAAFYRILCLVIVAYESYMFFTVGILTRIPALEVIYLLLLVCMLLVHTKAVYAILGVAIFNTCVIQPMESIVLKNMLLRADSLVCALIILTVVVMSLRGIYRSRFFNVVIDNG